MVTVPERVISAAVTMDTVPGNLPTKISLPLTGDILTKAVSTPLGTAATGVSAGGINGAGPTGGLFRLGGVLSFLVAAGGVTRMPGNFPG